MHKLRAIRANHKVQAPHARSAQYAHRHDQILGGELSKALQRAGVIN